MVFDRQSTHVAMLLWGCIFCLIAALCLFMSQNFDRQKRKWMLLMQSSTALLLLGDALAWAFRGYPGTVGYVMVRVSNFIVFAASDLILLFFHTYLCNYLFPKNSGKNIRRVKLVYAICVVGVLLVIISQFTNLYYYFDADNYYHRNPEYVISMLLPLVGMLVDCSMLVEYRENISKRMFLSMLSYITLPLAAVVVQLYYYGLSLINIAIAISMTLMFVASTVEQNEQWQRLFKKQAKTAEQLEISTTLNRCVRALSSDEDIYVAINGLLQIINDYFQADRSYIFEIDYDRRVITNTYEYVEHGVTEQLDNLQEVPLDTIAVWMEKFKEDQVYYIADLEQEKGSASYEILKAQEIERLLAVPLQKDKKTIGFLGVDNPKNHYDDATLLSSIQYFITNSLSKKEQQEQLEYLSYRDMLTGLYNRNKYIEEVESHEGQQVKKVGVAYMDLNGLKQVNDQQGHGAGDRLIRRTAETISEIFPGYAYRVGGDEFVIVYPDVDEPMFERKMTVLQEQLGQKEISVSVGILWREVTEDLEQLLKDADRCMYEEKERYHRG